MEGDTQRYLEQFCDAATGGCASGLSTTDQAQMLTGAGVEPFAWGAALRFSPTRTKAVTRELLQHHLLGIEVVRGEDGRNELRMTPTHETPRWYARVLRARAVDRRVAARTTDRNEGEAMALRG